MMGCGIYGDGLEQEVRLQPQQAQAQVLDLFLCESQRLVLRPNHLYRFRVDPTCEKCKEIEAEGKP